MVSSCPADRGRRRHPARWAWCVAVVVTSLAPAWARADVEWHPDLDTAHAAARISRRPVLAVFVAGWDDQARDADIPCLRSREAEAVLAACFEPVRIDIDEHEALTRAAGVTHVPAACVLAADDTVLDRFELSGRPAAFVTAAILAAQRVASLEHDAAADRVAALPDAATQRTASETVSAAAFGSGEETVVGPQRPPRGSMARVAAKVRDLSSFATGEGRTEAARAPVAPSTAIATASRSLIEPRSDYAPLTWPAEKAAVAPTAPTPPPAIEPLAQATVPTSTASWLDSAPQQPQPSIPQPAASQPSAPLATAPQPAPAAPAAQPSGLMAALQKPFGLGGKPAAAATPTMPPALPRGPLAALMPTKPPAAAAEPTRAAPAAAETAADTAAATATTDVHGSMPLGLEGYCPVSLVDRGAWTEGRAQWGARHRGRTYLFAGQSEQQTFLADPDRYAPALSGDDPVLALDRGSSTPGQRRYGVTYQARIYLFATPETRTAFTADPSRYTTRVALAERPTPMADGTRTY